MSASSTKQEQTFLSNSKLDKWIKMDNYDNCEPSETCNIQTFPKGLLENKISFFFTVCLLFS